MNLYQIALAKIIWANNQFMAIGEEGGFLDKVHNEVALVSSDGLNWQKRYLGDPAQMYLADIAWGNNEYVAVGGALNNVGIIEYSKDAIHWQQAIRVNGYFNKVIWSGSQFVAVGDNGMIFTSSDGVTWTAQQSGTNASLLGITVK